MVRSTFRLRFNGIAKVTAVILGAVALVWAVVLAPTILTNFSAGLHTSQDPTLIPDGAAQDLKNVDVWTGSLERRRGSLLQNSSPIGGFSDQAIRFQHEFPSSAGDFWNLIITSNSLYGSKDGGASQTLLTSTHGITATSRFQAVNAFGKARLTDGTTNWILFDGATISVSTPSPHGTVTAFFAGRIWTAGVAANPSILYMSRTNDPEDWTVDGLVTDDAQTLNIRINDGYAISALKPFRNGLVVFKPYSMDFVTMLPDGLTPTITPISGKIGTSYATTVQELPNELIFLGPDHYYKWTGSTLLPISGPIFPTVQMIQQRNAATRVFSETTQVDFGAGITTFTSITQIPGAVVVSSLTLIITSADDFAAGTIPPALSTAVLPGTLQFGRLIDDFSDGNFTSNPTWTHLSFNSGLAATVTVANGGLFFTGVQGAAPSEGIFTAAPFSTGSFSADFYYATNHSPTEVIMGLALCITTPTTTIEYCGSGYSLVMDAVNDNLRIYKDSTFLKSVSYTFNKNITYNLELLRDSTGTLAGYVNGSVVVSTYNTAYSSPAYIVVGANYVIGTSPGFYTNPFIDNIRADLNTLTTSYQSAPINMGATAIYVGSATITYTPNISTITFQLFFDSNTQVDVTDSASFISSITVVSGSTFTTTSSSYVVVLASFTRPNFDTGPILQDITLSLKNSTGSYRSLVAAGSDVSAWGTFSASYAGSTIAFALYSDTDSIVDPFNSMTWTASQTITSGQTPVFATSSFIHFLSTFALADITQAPQLDSWSFTWQVGAFNTPPLSIVFENEYISAVIIDSTTVNDTMLVYDRNGAWTRYKDLQASSLVLYRNRPYYGSATTGNIYQFQVDGVYTDNGLPIGVDWTSKNFNFGFPTSETTMQNYYITGTRVVGGAANFNFWTNRNSAFDTSPLVFDQTAGLFHVSIAPTRLTYQRGFEQTFQFSDTSGSDHWKILSVTLVPRLETSPP